MPEKLGVNAFNKTLQCFKKCKCSKHVETSQWIFWTNQLASSTWSENWGLLWEIMTEIAKAEKLGPTFLLKLQTKSLEIVSKFCF